MERQKIGILARWRDCQDKRKWNGEILLDLETSVPIQASQHALSGAIL